MTGLAAARAFDPTVHGGFIAAGAPTVFVGGQPAARVGDPHQCALTPPLLPPHIGGWLAEGSATVFICGQAAARLGDLCACCVAPLSTPMATQPKATAAGAYNTVESVAETFVDDEGFKHEIGVRVTKTADVTGDGIDDCGETDMAATKVTRTTESSSYFRRKQSYQTGVFHAKMDDGDAELELNGVRDAEQFEIGSDEDPLYTVSFEQKLAILVTEGHLTSPNEVGLDVGAKGQASAAEIKAKTKVDLVLVPPLSGPLFLARKYIGISADVAAETGGSLGGVDGELRAQLFEEKDGRYHSSLKGAIQKWGGFSIDLQFSIGKMKGRELFDGITWSDEGAGVPLGELVASLIAQAEADHAAHLLAVVPNAVAMGCPTVLIG